MAELLTGMTILVYESYSELTRCDTQRCVLRGPDPLKGMPRQRHRPLGDIGILFSGQTTTR